MVRPIDASVQDWPGQPLLDGHHAMFGPYSDHAVRGQIPVVARVSTWTGLCSTDKFELEKDFQSTDH